MKAGQSSATDSNVFAKYGKTVQVYNLGTKEYITMDSLNMQTVLATQVECFGNAPQNYEPCKDFLGAGIITTDGHSWKRSRQLLNPVFARAQVSDLSSFEVHFAKLMALIPRDGSTIDMQPLLKMLFLDSSTEFIFGKSTNSLSSDDRDTVAQRLTDRFDDAQRILFKRFILGRLKFLASSENTWLESCEKVHDIIDSFIDEEVELQKSTPEGLKPDTDTSYSYILLRELVKETDDKIFIRNQLMNVFFPARDSVGILAGNIIFMLARRPKIWNKVREETMAVGDQKLTFELLKSLKYTHAVINESMSL